MNKPEDKSYFITIDSTIKKIRADIQQKLNAHKSGLTVDQWVVLDKLHQHTGASLSELATASGKDAPTLSRIVDLLIKKGYIERKNSQNDGRKIHIFLTPAGTAKHDDVYPLVAEVRRKGWGTLSEEDYATLVRIMDTIHSNINA